MCFIADNLNFLTVIIFSPITSQIMTLAEAEATIERLSHLIGCNIRGSQITNFAILPDEGDLVTRIANALIDGNNYKEMLAGFSSFSVIVYYDLRELLTTGY